MNKSFLLILFLSVYFVGAEAQDKLIKFDDQRITYSGRTSYKTDAAELSWPGASVKINFTGTGVVLKGQDTSNYYNVILDGKAISKIHPDTSCKNYI